MREQVWSGGGLMLLGLVTLFTAWVHASSTYTLVDTLRRTVTTRAAVLLPLGVLMVHVGLTLTQGGAVLGIDAWRVPSPNPVFCGCG